MVTFTMEIFTFSHPPPLHFFAQLDLNPFKSIWNPDTTSRRGFTRVLAEPKFRSEPRQLGHGNVYHGDFHIFAPAPPTFFCPVGPQPVQIYLESRHYKQER